MYLVACWSRMESRVWSTCFSDLLKRWKFKYDMRSKSNVKWWMEYVWPSVLLFSWRLSDVVWLAKSWNCNMQIILLTIIGRLLFNLAEYVKAWGLVWLDRLLDWHLIDAHEFVSKISVKVETANAWRANVLSVIWEAKVGLFMLNRLFNLGFRY